MSLVTSIAAAYFDGVEIPLEEWRNLQTNARWKSGYFETMRLSAGKIPLWTYHKSRLERGARHTDIPVPELDFLQDVFKQFNTADYRCRLTVLKNHNRASSAVLAISTLPNKIYGYRLKTASLHHPFTGNDAHEVKLSDRDYYDTMFAEADDAGYNDALLYDASGLVSETCIANLLMLGPDGQFYTPSTQSKPLSGVGLRFLRDILSANPETPVHDAMLFRQQLIKSKALWIVNALRGVTPVVQIDEHSLPIDPLVTKRISSVFPF
jgi:branched-subunit amino acid aminotransferase/4-amino-4-deoxychorismate lyase